MKALHKEVLQSLLSAPTAPFGEGEVAQRIRQWAGRLGLSVRADAAGNLFLRPRGARRKGARWLFAAHMDHPGFLARRQRGREVEADFIGGVRPEFFAGARAVFFTPAGPAKATVLSAKPALAKTHLRCRLRLAKRASLPPGTVGMWDLPAMRISGPRLASRACDDVVGSAAVLCALAEIVSHDPRAAATGLFTVAEEAGLVGATAACEAGDIPRGTLLVAIETSAAQPRARLGDGVVVRVGDRVWTFDPCLTADIAAVAADLAKGDRAFRFTRQLMPGGVCESTAYCLWGHQAAGLCLPLGNYHNMSPRGCIAAEQIDLGDFESLVKLLAALPASRQASGAAGSAIKKRLHNRLRQWRNRMRSKQ